MFQVQVQFFIGLFSKNGDPLDRDEVIRNIIEPAFTEFGVDGFTVTDALGYYKGQPEASLVVTVLADEAFLNEKAEKIARRVAEGAVQECVLVAATPLVAAKFVA